MKPKDRWGEVRYGNGWQILDGMLRASSVDGLGGRPTVPIDRIDMAMHGDGHKHPCGRDYTIILTPAGALNLDVPLMEVLTAMAELRGGDRTSVVDYMRDGPVYSSTKRTNAGGAA